MTARRPYDAIKRAIDVALSAAVLTLTAPIQCALAVLVRRSLGTPVLFRQQRPGQHGTPFTLIKFRTMRDIDHAAGLVSDTDRITPLGATLRSTSLDELPTLWNVLRGDMSLVGPRPLLMQYLGRYSPEQARRHDVRPGITGLAQVSGRNAITWEEKFDADLVYVRDRSLALDAKILLRTITSVIRRDGIDAAEGPMPEFLGSASHREG